MDVIAVVLAAGQGARLSAGAPKAELRLAGRSVLGWSARALARAPGVDAVLPVVPAGGEATVRDVAADWDGPARLLEAATGGATRQDSLAAGLASLGVQAPAATWVLVHDAARCLVLPEDAEAVLEAARPTGAALPVLGVGDTIKEVEGDRVITTPERARLVHALTPQAFRVAILREAVEKARREDFLGTDCSSLVERLGVAVRTCPGRDENWKITLPADLQRAEAVLRARGPLS